MFLVRLGFAAFVSCFVFCYTPAAFSEELVLWESESDDIQKVWDNVNAEFQKENPTIKIKRSHYKVEDLRTQFQTAAMGGGGADMLIGPNDWAGPFSVMGIIQDVQSWGKTDRFSPMVLASISDVNKKVWGLPVSKGNHLMLFINKKLIPKTPDTLEDLIKSAKSISEPDKKKFGFAYNLTEPFWFVTFLSAYGEKPLLPGGKPNLNTEGMIKALELVKKLKFEDRIVPPDCGYDCANTLFVEGKVGVIINGDWSIEKYREVLKDNLVIAPLPKLAATGKFMQPMVSGKYLFFHKNLKSKKFDAAKLYADYITSSKVQELLIQKTGRLSPLKTLENSPLITGNPIYAATNAAMVNGQPMPLDVEMRVVWDAVRPQLQEVMSGRADPKEAAKIMQKDAETKIREMKG